MSSRTEISGKVFIQKDGYNPYQGGGEVTGHLRGNEVNLSLEWIFPLDQTAPFEKPKSPP